MPPLTATYARHSLSDLRVSPCCTEPKQRTAKFARGVFDDFTTIAIMRLYPGTC